jgi:Flp pilus assembly protein TadG
MIAIARWLRRRRLARNNSGMAAVEFALLMPALFTLLIGSFETSNLLLAYLKLESAAETAADLVAQTDVKDGANHDGVLQSTDFTNITNAVGQVMTPLSTANLKIAYASITFNTGTAVINWHAETNSATPISLVNLPGGVTATTMGTASSGSTDSLIVVQLTYPNTSPLSSYFNTNYTLTEWAYNRPRYVSCVPTYLNNGSVCP